MRERIRLHKPEMVSLLNGLQSRQTAAVEAGCGGTAEERVPLSYAQQRMWFLAQMEPASGAYNIAVALRLDGQLDVALLQEALNRVVARHEALRTTVAVEQEHAVQWVHPVIDAGIGVEVLEPAPPSEHEAAVRRRLEQEALRPFDLERGPLLRALLLRLAATKHVLLLTMHHIIGDGWSRGVLNRELSVCYNALVRGTDPVLPVLRVQYADYARWQRDYLHGPEMQRQLDYWKSRLDGLEQLNLPIDKPRPAQLSGRGDSVGFSLPHELSEALYALSRRHGVTPFMLLLAGFAVLLYRYSGQTDIAVGTPIAGRRRKEFEELVGFFVNTLVMRTDLAGDPPFTEVLRRVRDTALDAYDHQDLPFERLVEELAPARDRSRNPVFQVMFAFLNVPESPLQLEGLEVSRFPMDLRNELFDLSLTMQMTSDGLVGTFSYSSDLFETGSIERMAGGFRHLLESVVADPARPVHALAMLDDRELRALLLDWNATARRYDADVCIQTMIEQQAARAPEQVAVVCGGARLAYGELNASANRLAHFLRAQGVAPDQLIGLCIRPSLEMVVAILGVLKAGGAYVPMDPGYPADRLAFMIEDSGVPLVLSDGELPLAQAPLAARTVRLDRDRDAIAQFPAVNPPAVVDGSNLAYMIYTSGSTGQPKGVLIEHRSVRNLAEGLRERLGCDAVDRPLRNCLSASISFDASVDNWVMLAFGDELHVIEQELRTDSAGLLRYVREQQIDRLDSVPAQLALLVEEGLLEGSWVPPIITVGGEAVDPQLWDRLGADTRAAIYNLYGPTECTVEVMVARIGADSGTPVIGRPLANSRIYLLDGHGNPVPPGAVGEIHIGGDGLARGYHRRPELTAEKFVMHTLPGHAPQRLYRTGDFGRFLPDGTLVFLGRRDGLVKLRGHTIELGEVEAVIALMPGVLGVTAILREDDPVSPILVAYVRGDPAAKPDVDELREMAQSKLPAYMVPAAFVIVDRFPLTPSGKIDRKALPRPDMAGTHSRYAAPETALQRQLSGIWGAFIAAGRIGIDDDFFELGGHSLLATRVINRINRDCGVNLALRVLFEQPTIRRLSAAIGQLAYSGDAATTGAESPIAVQPRVARKRPKPEE
ncbi:MAG: amino acid adenylation domain-containing protein [Gammaproteobacteria bacterium]|nr:amino acid adenylation domain-containing protein [Gammaproteobacteria bacterium]